MLPPLLALRASLSPRALCNNNNNMLGTLYAYFPSSRVWLVLAKLASTQAQKSWMPVKMLSLFLPSQLCTFLALSLPFLSHLSFPSTIVVGPHRSLLSPGPIYSNLTITELILSWQCRDNEYPRRRTRHVPDGEIQGSGCCSSHLSPALRLPGAAWSPGLSQIGHKSQLECCLDNRDGWSCAFCHLSQDRAKQGEVLSMSHGWEFGGFPGYLRCPWYTYVHIQQWTG